MTIGTDESAFKREVSRHHTRLMLMQKHSKRLAFATQDEELMENKNEIELAQENADVSAFAGLPSDDDDDFEREED
jgi:hypothetical protein